MNEWLKTRIEARIWFCGDDECNCNQPQIERITPNKECGEPWVRRERLWVGTFMTNGEGFELHKKELDEAVDKFRSEGYAVEID